MARVPYLTEDDLKPEHREVIKLKINLARALANSPGAALSFGQLGLWIRCESHLNPRLRELAILQVGYLTRAKYEYAHHIKIGRQFGVSDEDILAIMLETTGGDSDLPELDRAVLRAAREMTGNLKISDSAFALLRRHLNDELIVDLVLVVAFYNGVVRLLESLEIDVEPDYETYLKEFPLSVSTDG